MTDYTTLQSLLASIGSTDGSATPAAAQANPKRKFMLVGTHAQQTTGYSKVSYNIIQPYLTGKNKGIYPQINIRP